MDKRLLILVGGFAVAAAGLWWVASRFTVEPEPKSSAPVRSVAPVVEVAPEPAPAERDRAPQSPYKPRSETTTRPAPVRRAPAPPAAPDATAVHLRVVDAVTGEPVTRYEASADDDLGFVNELTRRDLNLLALLLGTRTQDSVPVVAIENDKGETRLPAPAERPLTLFVRSEGYVPAGEAIAPLAPGDTRSVEVRLDRGATVAVQVTNAAGEPLANADVELDVTETGFAAHTHDTIDDSGVFWPLGTTSENGEVELQLPVNTPLDLAAKHAAYRLEMKRVQLATAQTAKVPIVLHGPGVITGVVTANGQPVAGAMVMARPRNGARGDERRRGWRDRSERDDQGRDERYESERSRGPTALPPRGGLGPGAADDPAEEWRRQRRDDNGPRLRFRGGAAGATPEYESDGPAGGVGPDTADDPAMEWRRQRRERTPPPLDPAAVERRLQWAEQRRAEAEASGGDDNAGESRSGSYRDRDGWRSNRTETNEHGVYRIEGLDDGEYEVSVMTWNGDDGGFAGGQRLTRYAVVAQDMETELNFELPTQSSAITGTVTVNGKPAAMGFVRGVVRYEDGQQPFVTRVDDSGRYEVVLPPGEAELLVFARPTGVRNAATTRLSVTVPPRSTVRQDIELAR